MISPQELRAKLAHHTGSETFIRSSLNPNVVYTEGVVALCNEAQCWWLTDILASYQSTERFDREHFQAWCIVVDEETRSAVVSCTNGNSKKPIVEQRLEYTDFPLAHFSLWVEGPRSQRVAMLPQER